LASGLALGIASLLATRLPAWLSVLLTIAGTAAAATPFRDIPGSLSIGVFLGIPGGLAGIWIAGQDKLSFAERLEWSWPRATWGLAIGVALGLGIHLGFGEGDWLTDVLFVALPFTLLFTLVLGLRPGQLQRTRKTPDQGIRRSIRNALRAGLAVGLAITLALATIGVLQGELDLWLAWIGLIGPPVALAFGLRAGGAVCLQHVVLRLILYGYGHLPWKIIPFLDYAVERILLRRVGGGYIFAHGLLLEYLASLEIPGPE
jgi:hypothetical protein